MQKFHWTSAQYSEVLLDIGSEALWIAWVDCVSCKGNNNIFNYLESTTFINTTKKYEIVYGTGKTQGFFSCYIISNGNLTVDSFLFLVSFEFDIIITMMEFCDWEKNGFIFLDLSITSTRKNP